MTAALAAAAATAIMVSGSNGLAAARLLSRTFLRESCLGSLLQVSSALGLHVLPQGAAGLFQAGPREGRGNHGARPQWQLSGVGGDFVRLGGGSVEARFWAGHPADPGTYSSPYGDEWRGGGGV